MDVRRVDVGGVGLHELATAGGDLGPRPVGGGRRGREGDEQTDDDGADESGNEHGPSFLEDPARQGGRSRGWGEYEVVMIESTRPATESHVLPKYRFSGLDQGIARGVCYPFVDLGGCPRTDVGPEPTKSHTAPVGNTDCRTSASSVARTTSAVGRRLAGRAGCRRRGPRRRGRRCAPSSTSPSSSRTAQAEHSPSRQEYGALTPLLSRKSSSDVRGSQSSKACVSPSSSTSSRTGGRRRRRRAAASAAALVGRRSRRRRPPARPRSTSGRSPNGLPPSETNFSWWRRSRGNSSSLQRGDGHLHERRRAADERVVRRGGRPRTPASAPGVGSPCTLSSQCTTWSRSGCAAASSAELAGEDHRPLVAVGVEEHDPAGAPASAVRVIDMIGVMPLPPAKSSRSASSEAGREDAAGRQHPHGVARVEVVADPVGGVAVGRALDRDGQGAAARRAGCCTASSSARRRRSGRSAPRR